MQDAVDFNTVVSNKIKDVVIFVWKKAQVNDEIVASYTDFRISKQ